MATVVHSVEDSCCSSELACTGRKCKCICVCMCGVPGGGKTTLCNELCKLSRELKCFIVSHVEFDKVLHARIEDAGGSFDSELWHASRSEFLHAAEMEIMRMNCDAGEHVDESVRRIVLLDDNFNLSSMRLAIARIALHYNCAFAVVTVTQSLDEARKRNELREGISRVDASVMSKMIESMEYPWNGNHFWERFSFHIDGTVNPLVEEQAQILIQWLQSIPLEPVVLVDPAKEPMEKNNRLINESSFKQEFDLWMRKVISKLLASVDETQRAEAAKVFASAKKTATKPRCRDEISNAKRSFLAIVQQSGFVNTDIINTL